MFTLAGGRIDRETEHYLRWWMPIEDALGYFHKAVYDNDILHWTVEPGTYEDADEAATVAPPSEQARMLRAATEDDEISEDLL